MSRKPPKTYSQVKYYKSRKLAWTGVDGQGKLQYGYTEAWSQRSKNRKFCKLKSLAQNLPKILRAVKNLFRSPRLEDREIAAILQLILACHFRIGTKSNTTFGASTLQKRHVDRNAIEFSGKKGVCNTCDIRTSFLREFLAGKSPRDAVFTISAKDVNEWLQAQFHTTAKAFRDLAANLLLIELGKRAVPLKEAMTVVSSSLHNTTGILRKNYLVPELVAFYGSPDFAKIFKGSTRLKFIRFLSKIC